MASLWSSLEKDVFNPQKKRLLETIRVWKTGKKKKMSILCVVVDTFRPMQPFLVKVKVDRGEQYKIAYRWPLAELQLVDGKTLNQASLDFDLQFDKVYKWTASSFEEKKTFIRCLWKLNHRFLTSSITFVNVPSYAVEGNYQDGLSVYQEMTPKEAADVLKLMEEHEPLVNNSVAFAERLSNDLHVLDEANLRAIISSEKQVTQLMSSIDEALAEVARVEETLQIYDELLGSVKQQMDHIHRENSLLHCIISNKTRLMDEILFLTTHLSLSREHCDALSRADLSSPSRVKACIAAAEALSACMNIQVQPVHLKLRAGGTGLQGQLSAGDIAGAFKGLAASPRSTVRQGWESITSEHPWRKVAVGATGFIPREIQFTLQMAKLGYPHTTGRSAGASGLRHRLVQITLESRQAYGTHAYNSSKYLAIVVCHLYKTSLIVWKGTGGKACLEIVTFWGNPVVCT
uniref:Exocyst complex component Sec3 PIP2-binding N-terminal domain-containing protein n=1 Tax=Athene cunicularia TaxID=194338 RepID=A0A663MAW5_ATHCN